MTTANELHKAIAESNLTKDQIEKVLIARGTQGIFCAVGLFQDFVKKNNETSTNIE